MKAAGILFLSIALSVLAWSQAGPQVPATAPNIPTAAPSSVENLGGNPQASPVVPEISGHDYADRAVQPVGNSDAHNSPPVTAKDDRVAFHSSVKDIYFELDRFNLTADDRATLEKDAEWLKAHPNVQFTIEGDADERGGIAYNLHLSDQRAIATRDALLKLGVPEKQILFANGWGKLYPTCVQSDESCWQQNRRSHFAPWPPEDLGVRAANHLPSTEGETNAGGGK